MDAEAASLLETPDAQPPRAAPRCRRAAVALALFALAGAAARRGAAGGGAGARARASVSEAIVAASGGPVAASGGAEHGAAVAGDLGSLRGLAKGTAAAPAPAATAAAAPAPAAAAPVLRVDAALTAARAKYSEAAVEAFAALAKLAYCGPKPGIFSAVAQACTLAQPQGALPSPCSAANFEVVPGLVRTVTSADLDDADAIFAYAARVRPGQTGGGAAVGDGVVIAVRGSIDDFANSLRDKDTRLHEMEGCNGCQVHEGFHKVFHRIESKLEATLQEFDCQKGTCEIYVTGHSSGAAVATMFAYELASLGHKIGTSYVFAPPMLGDGKFAAEIGRVLDASANGPVFKVVDGKNSVARWPFSPAFAPWGIEAYYNTTVAKTASVICYSDDPACGINAVAKAALTGQDMCNSALAPGGSFCRLDHYQGLCMAGMSFNTLDQIGSAIDALHQQGVLPFVPPEAKQPDDEAAVRWHPSQADGKQEDAEKKELKKNEPSDYYKLQTVKAFAALAKLAYCGNSPGVAASVQKTCAGKGSVCSTAGFAVVPNSVVPVVAPFAGRSDALFFYTANLRRTTREFADAPYFVPAEACVLVFRGTQNEENNKMNNRLNQYFINDPECFNCTISKGLFEAWNNSLESKVVKALKKSGCEAKPREETTSKVVIVGHSMGGTMSTVASFFLRRMGFHVELSWSIEGGRPGNDDFLNFINKKAFSDTRVVPLWHVSYVNDGIARWPKDVGGEPAGRLQYQVHYPGGNLARHVLCTKEEEAQRKGRCGVFNYTRKDLSFELMGPHCRLPYAPQQMICMPVPSFQCYTGSALPM